MKAKELPHHDVHAADDVHNSKERSLFLYNDDVHTFDYVIEALIEVCHLDLLQAEQCTLLVHYKGKCDVKKGTFSYLRPLKNALVRRDLKATIV